MNEGDDSDEDQPRHKAIAINSFVGVRQNNHGSTNIFNEVI